MASATCTPLIHLRTTQLNCCSICLHPHRGFDRCQRAQTRRLVPVLRGILRRSCNKINFFCRSLLSERPTSKVHLFGITGKSICRLSNGVLATCMHYNVCAINICLTALPHAGYRISLIRTRTLNRTFPWIQHATQGAEINRTSAF